MKDRRVAALRVSIGRCERLERTLRRELERCRREYDAQAEQCRLDAERLQEASAALQARTDELDAMTGGNAPFSLDGFNRARRYLEVVAERQHACAVEMERQQAVLAERETALDKARQSLARNQARAEFFAGRMQVLVRADDDRATDAADDEAQEAALARALRERSAAV
ncbi:hypothetical protein [Trinickia acidisoli]|uniref:hypothetical protein n=1 Tax=Trinickia acidisoli TaxID=2767482 RepID=UPI001A8E72A8|nr:hypothetical protein [Trinickia acidisoli]